MSFLWVPFVVVATLCAEKADAAPYRERLWWEFTGLVVGVCGAVSVLT